MRDILVAAMIGLALLAGPAAGAPSTLDVSDQKVFDAGMEAVRQERWQDAIEKFDHLSDKRYPPALLNLGLAHVKAGHELAGLIWLHEYLAVSPQAPNASAVLREIETQRATAQQKIDKVLQTARDLAEKLTGEKFYAGSTIPMGPARDNAISAIRDSYASADDMKNATAGLTPGSFRFRLLWVQYAGELAQAGLFAEAEAAAKAIGPDRGDDAHHEIPKKVDDVWRWAADSKHRFGDDIGARAYALRMVDPEQRRNELDRIASRKGDWTGYDEAAVWSDLLHGSPLGSIGAEATLRHYLDVEATQGASDDKAIVEAMTFSAGDEGSLLLQIRGIERHFNYAAAPGR